MLEFPCPVRRKSDQASSVWSFCYREETRPRNQGRRSSSSSTANTLPENRVTGSEGRILGRPWLTGGLPGSRCADDVLLRAGYIEIRLKFPIYEASSFWGAVRRSLCPGGINDNS